MAELVIICPELSRGSGGVADYTLRIVEQWRDRREIRFLVPFGRGTPETQLPGHMIETVARDSAALAAKLPTDGGKILLQYSAYGFDHFGYPRWLLRALTDWKKQVRGSLVIMFHEIWTFWPILNKNYFVQQLHRRDIRTLLAHTDAVFTSTASQAEHLRRLAPQRRIEVLPVGANVQPTNLSSTGRHSAVAVLFGLQRTRCRTLELMQPELTSLAQRNAIVKLVTVGSGEEGAGAARERVMLESLQLRDGFEQRGQSDEEELSKLFLGAEFGISGQDDLSLTKSGTFMTYAAHGLNVISPAARADAEPLCWLTAPGELLRGISTGELSQRAECLRDWQERSASWPHIAAEFARALQIAT